MIGRKIKTIGASGRVSIPFDLRVAYGMEHGTPVVFTDTGNGILITKADIKDIVDPNTKPTISKDAAHAVVAGCRSGAITQENFWAELTNIVHGGN